MILHLMSDVHLEHMPDHGAQFLASLDRGDADALVLAGDILPLHWASAPRIFLRFLDVYKKVFYVAGNHEYYNTEPRIAFAQLKSMADTVGFDLLEYGREPVEFMDYRFLGGTMWFPEGPDDYLRRRDISDFSLIRGANPWVYQEHESFKGYLGANLKENDIVVTHHLPSPKSIARRFLNSPINGFFMADMSDLIARKKPALWMHGHTHDKFDYMLGSTRVACNPKGYPREIPGVYKPLELVL